MTGQPFVDRYRAHGLDHNPFAGEAEAQCSVFVSRELPSPPPAGALAMVQVLGEKGAGKTSQIQHWRRARPGPYFYVPSSPGRERWRKPPVEPLVYADEVDRMPVPRRVHWFRQLARAHSTLVVGTHEDLAPVAIRAGLNVTTHHLGPIDLPTLRRVADARIQAAALADSCFAIGDEELFRVHTLCEGSLRAAHRHLHELVAHRVLDPPPRP